MNEEQRFVDVNGAQVMDLTPDYDRALALVDLDVLKRLTKLLPTANIYDITQGMISNLRDVQSIEEYVAILSKELAFHTTVNLINEVNKSEVNVVGKIDLDSCH
mgnify:FL=1|tara:strand:- start:5 stop:316 length:312 start_codon:yes stop_codon:yes gene_type:complete